MIWMNRGFIYKEYLLERIEDLTELDIMEGVVMDKWSNLGLKLQLF